MVRACPNCGLVNPPEARRCDCGYDFADGRVGASPLTEAERARLAPARGTGVLVGCALVGLGVLLGIGVGLLWPADGNAGPDQEHRFCGLFVLPQLIARVAYGALLGGLAGLVAAAVFATRRNRLGR